MRLFSTRPMAITSLGLAETVITEGVVSEVTCGVALAWVPHNKPTATILTRAEASDAGAKAVRLMAL